MAKTPNVQYCWLFKHPIAGWCGGTADDNWDDDKAVVERNASFCEWETRIVTRPRQYGQKKAPPGSVRPSIRNPR